MGLAHAFRSKKWIDAGDADSVLVLKNSVYLGAQVNYLFGELIQQSRLDIEDITFLDNRTSTSMRHRSLGGVLDYRHFNCFMRIMTLIRTSKIQLHYLLVEHMLRRQLYTLTTKNSRICSAFK